MAMTELPCPLPIGAPHLERMLAQMDAHIAVLLNVYRSDPNNDILIEDLIRAVDLADELRYELCTDEPKIPDDHYDFLMAMVRAGRIDAWAFDDDDQ